MGHLVWICCRYHRCQRGIAFCPNGYICHEGAPRTFGVAASRLSLDLPPFMSRFLNNAYHGSERTQAQQKHTSTSHPWRTTGSVLVHVVNLVMLLILLKQAQDLRSATALSTLPGRTRSSGLTLGTDVTRHSLGTFCPVPTGTTQRTVPSAKYNFLSVMEELTMSASISVLRSMCLLSLLTNWFTSKLRFREQ